MTGLENIINQILGEANVRAKEIRDQASKNVDAIKAEASAEGQNVHSQLLDKAKADADAYHERMKSSAEFQRKRAILQAKQETIAQVIDQAYTKLSTQDTEGYFQMILKMLEKSVLAQPGIIYFSEADLKRMPQGFEEKIIKTAQDKGGTLELSKETKAINAGFILAYGGIEENCSLKALFDARRDELQDKVHEILFA